MSHTDQTQARVLCAIIAKFNLHDSLRSTVIHFKLWLFYLKINVSTYVLKWNCRKQTAARPGDCSTEPPAQPEATMFIEKLKKAC